MSSRPIDLGTKYNVGLPEQQPLVERHTVSSGGAATAAESGATEAAALRGIGGKDFSRAKFAKYLEAMAIAAGNKINLPDAYRRQLDRVCEECRDKLGMSPNEVGVMRYAVGRELQKRLGG